MQQRTLGTNGPRVGAIGYGAMGLEGYYGAADEQDAVNVIAHAIGRGMMIDTADAYGNGHNETLVGRTAKAQAGAFIATKFGIVIDGAPGTPLATGWGFSLTINGRPDYARRAVDASLARLGVEAIDLW